MSTTCCTRSCWRPCDRGALPTAANSPTATATAAARSIAHSIALTRSRPRSLRVGDDRRAGCAARSRGLGRLAGCARRAEHGARVVANDPVGVVEAQVDVLELTVHAVLVDQQRVVG